MVGQQLQYVTHDKDDNVNTQTLCTQDIPYPQRVRNIQSLVNIRKVFANQVSSSLKSIQEIAKFVEKSVDLFERGEGFRSGYMGEKLWCIAVLDNP